MCVLGWGVSVYVCICVCVCVCEMKSRYLTFTNECVDVFFPFLKLLHRSAACQQQSDMFHATWTATEDSVLFSMRDV